MIARDAELQALQHNSPVINVLSCHGDNPPPDNEAFSDLNLTCNELDQLLLQNLDIPLSLDDLSMQCDDQISHNTPSQQITQAALDTSFQQNVSYNSTNVWESNLAAFFQSLSGPNDHIKFAPPSASTTPPFSGGSTPQGPSRAGSPAWSESSGNMSTSSISGVSCPRKLSQGNSIIPRHKRPSHKRAEVKRRDKIKTSLDEVKAIVPSLQDKGKLSESAILIKAAEYIHQLKDGISDRGSKAAELRREVQNLSEEIHSVQEMLPVSGLMKEHASIRDLDRLYGDWVTQQSQISKKHFIFTSITTSLFESFKQVVGNTSDFESMATKTKDWQVMHLSLPSLRKQILKGMLKLTKSNNVVTFQKDLHIGSSVDPNS